MADQFTIIKEVGRGTFGCVSKAINNENGEIVAIKAIKETYQSSQICYNKEVKPLVKLGDHDNIIKLQNVFEDKVDNENTLFLVFEYMDTDLHTVIQENYNDNQVIKRYGEPEIKKWFVQFLQGLDYTHQEGYMHRDLKPSNILVTENRDNLKIADFGSACKIDDKTACIDYVTTRWYRAPEVLFGSTNYGPEIDMWAAGTILAELFMGRPIFPGSSSTDQIYKICGVLGKPSVYDIHDGYPIEVMSYDFPPDSGLESSVYDNIASLIPSASDAAINLIKMLCSWDPYKRPTAAQALQHPFFDDFNNPISRQSDADIVDGSKQCFNSQASEALLKGRGNPRATTRLSSLMPPPGFTSKNAYCS